MPQTTMTSRQVQWLGEGQYASTRARSVDGAVMSAYADGFVAYGRVAVLDPLTNKVKALTGAPAATDIIVIPVLQERFGETIPNMLLNTLPDIGYAAGSMVEYITEGDVVMWSENGGTLGNAVFFRHAAGVAPNNKVGRVRKDADAALTTQKTTIRFAETKTSAGLIAVRVMTSVSI
jgi:hypothetical protein